LNTVLEDAHTQPLCAFERVDVALEIGFPKAILSLSWAIRGRDRPGAISVHLELNLLLNMTLKGGPKNIFKETEIDMAISMAKT
jgi:hypothetical protein